MTSPTTEQRLPGCGQFVKLSWDAGETLMTIKSAPIAASAGFYECRGHALGFGETTLYIARIPHTGTHVRYGDRKAQNVSFQIINKSDVVNYLVDRQKTLDDDVDARRDQATAFRLSKAAFSSAAELIL